MKQEQLPKNLIGYVNSFRYRLYRAQKLSKKTLASSQTKMKTLHDRQTERRTFLPGDQVLVLLLVTGSTFKARYSGPHTVIEKLSDQNYIIATPGRRTGKQLSHVNLLKPYFFHAEVGGGQEAGTPGASPACVTTSGFSHIGTELGEQGLLDPNEAMLCGRLKNSESLHNLNVLLGQLDLVKQAQLINLN